MWNRYRIALAVFLGASVSLSACGGTDEKDDDKGTGGSGGSGGSGPTTSDLPIPPGDGVPKPSGAPENLTVVDWAGFASAVSYTFDDTLVSQTQHYPELQATGVRMTFYLVCGNNFTNPVWAQAVADGHEIGNHTLHHCNADGTSCAGGAWAGSPEAELTECTTQIMDTFGLPAAYTMAAPYGNAGWTAVAEPLFLINRGVVGGQVAPNDASNPFSLPCHVAAMGETADQFNVQIDSSHTAKKWQLLLIHSLGGDGGYNPVTIEDVVASVEHAKSFGDVWIDSVVNVGAYWRAQKLFGAATPATAGSGKVYTWTLPPNFPPGKFVRVRMDGGTLKQNGRELEWDSHGYYEVALDPGTLTLSP
jgi:hypothetical protein